eukprot:9434055-Karenia_brevis.AAC.1
MMMMTTATTMMMMVMMTQAILLKALRQLRAIYRTLLPGANLVCAPHWVGCQWIALTSDRGLEGEIKES